MVAVQKLSVSAYNIEVSSEDFQYFQKTIYSLAGIRLSEQKQALVKTRLRTRLTALKLNTYSDYRSFLQNLPKDHEEWTFFINTLTTNKTDWFREASHFQFLVERAIPQWKKQGKRHLKVWCAASSTGEEPYTLAIVLDRELGGEYTFEIQATDIDTKVLAVAQNGVYPKADLIQIPEAYRKVSFSLGTEAISQWMKVKGHLKDRVQFGRFNLTDSQLSAKSEFDIIFCRNVLIYFENETIEHVLAKLHQAAAPESILFVGHSESVQRIKNPFKYLKTSIYTKGKFFERI